MSLLVANDALRATTIGGSGQTTATVHATPLPEPDPIRFPTDLGSITHLFQSGPTSFIRAAEHVLPRATDSLRGPHGGLVPSSLQHALASGVSVVQGDQLLHAVGGSVRDRVTAEVARLRSMVGL